MSDEKIIKILECCAYNDGCKGCKYSKQCDGAEHLINALDLIKRQKAEIERLQKEVNLVSILFQDVQERAEEYKLKIENLQNVISNQQIEISAKIEKQIKSEAYKEFTEKLKEEFLNLQYNAKTDRKNVKIEELKEQMDWLLHAVAIETVENLLKEMVGEEE